MRSTKAILAAAMAIVTVACGPQESLNPLCTNEEAVADMALIGDWQEQGSDTVLEIDGKWQAQSQIDASGGDVSSIVPPELRSYSILYVEGKDKKVTSFEGRMVRL